MTIKPVELTDTIALMNSGDFKDRFRAEYYQLTIRLGKLENMLAKMSKRVLVQKHTKRQKILAALYLHKLGSMRTRSHAF